MNHICLFIYLCIYLCMLRMDFRVLCMLGKCIPLSYILRVIFFFQHVLVFDLRTLCLVDRCSGTWAMPPVLFCFGYFWDRVSHLWPGQPGLLSSSLHFPHSWDDRHVPPHPTFYWLRCGLVDFMAKPSSTIVLPISASQVARTAGVSHCACPTTFFFKSYQRPGMVAHVSNPSY
jgi:hypothetical protein